MVCRTFPLTFSFLDAVNPFKKHAADGDDQLFIGRDVKPFLGQQVKLADSVLRSRPYMQVHNFDVSRGTYNIGCHIFPNIFLYRIVDKELSQRFGTAANHVWYNSTQAPNSSTIPVVPSYLFLNFDY